MKKTSLLLALLGSSLVSNAQTAAEATQSRIEGTQREQPAPVTGQNIAAQEAEGTSPSESDTGAQRPISLKRSGISSFFGYDTKVWDDAAAGTVDEADSWMVGLTWKDIVRPDDRIGVALTQPLKATSIAGGGDTNEVDPLLWEAYYSWKANDSMTITPAIFGGSDSFQADDDTFGAVVTTAFKF